MHTSEGREVVTPPRPQGRPLPRRRRRYAAARTATNRPCAGNEAVTAGIGKAYRPEECARSTIYVCLYRAGFTVVIPTYQTARARPSLWTHLKSPHIISWRSSPSVRSLCSRMPKTLL